MKKIILSLFTVMATMNINAQTVMIYKNDSKTPEATYINSDSHKYKVVFEEADANLLSGIFSVSETKKVQFTKGNLYWDGSEFMFEANQTDYNKSWDANHISHFYWAKTAATSYAEIYSDDTRTTSDVPFFAESTGGLTVEGTSGLYALTGGPDGEWNYLLTGRTNASKLYKFPVTVNGEIFHLILAPDDFTGELKSSYTLDEVNAAGLVCLPPAGNRDGIKWYDTGGLYWSSTPYSDSSNKAHVLNLTNDFIRPTDLDFRDIGDCLRLVRTLK